MYLAKAFEKGSRTIYSDKLFVKAFGSVLDIQCRFGQSLDDVITYGVTSYNSVCHTVSRRMIRFCVFGDVIRLCVTSFDIGRLCLQDVRFWVTSYDFVGRMIRFCV